MGDTSHHHQVLIVGGGTAGITVAASLRRRGRRAVDIAIVEPSDTHYYQPAFTLVGAGIYDLARTRRPTDSLLPAGVGRIKAAAESFDPANNAVALSNGDTVTYDYLVVCTGVKFDWGKIAGLKEALGHGGVCSNYSPDHVGYTWECIKALKPGGRAVFTQPSLLLNDLIRASDQCSVQYGAILHVQLPCDRTRKKTWRIRAGFNPHTQRHTQVHPTPPPVNNNLSADMK